MPDTLSSLRDAFRRKGSVLVAFSGGVDSAVLAKVGADVLGERALAVVVDSESYPRAERDAAVAFARDLGILHEVVFRSELADDAYRANAVDRCFHCRKNLSSALLDLAAERGFAAVAAGTNTSDLGEWRPGLLALREARVWQPFLELGVDKAGVRDLARTLGLPVAEKPSMACLSSRIPYGEEITDEKLRRVERAEEAVRARGYVQVRVRSLGDRARLEVGADEVARALEDDALVRLLLDAGYRDAEVDPQGYRSGALNEGLALPTALRLLER